MLGRNDVLTYFSSYRFLYFLDIMTFCFSDSKCVKLIVRKLIKNNKLILDNATMLSIMNLDILRYS